METVYPRKRENPKAFLDAVVGDARRQVESKRVEEEVAAGNIELDLRKAIEVRSCDSSSAESHLLCRNATKPMYQSRCR